MKIAYRLVMLSAFSALGLACVAGVSFVAVTTIQSDLRGLTLQATPLQNKTYEQQERTERVLGNLMRLTVATSKEDIDQLTSTVTVDMRAIEQLNAELRQLDTKASQDYGPFMQAQQEITRSVEKRLSDAAAYRQEAERTHQALQTAAKAVAVTRQGVNQIAVDAGQAADRAQEISRNVAAQIKQALTAQTRLKEIALVVHEADAVSSRFKLTPLKEKVKSSIDSVLRVEVRSPGEEVLKDTKVLLGAMSDAFSKEGTGLLALRANVLANKPDAEAAYQKQRRAILTPIEEQMTKLGTVIDALEVQAFKQRQQLEAALKLRNEPGGVVGTSEQVSLDIREMVGSLRLLMLAASEKERHEAHADLKKLASQLTANLDAMKIGLGKMGRTQLVPPVETASAALVNVGRSIETMAEAKARLLASEQSMQKALSALKSVATARAEAGAAQVRDISERQREVSSAVDARVRASLMLIVGISAAIIIASAVLSWHIVRSVRQRLQRAVSVAQAVSRGRLDTVPAERASDEAAQVLDALGSMVGTLRGTVTSIHGAAREISMGSTEISSGNADLSQRTERQANRLEATAAAIAELNVTLQGNTESAREAASLAERASAVADSGGQAVQEVVRTMNEIQDSSRAIADIVGVIDGIAFQTNILALNAAVEAARAGEQGRGFAVVAGEVRTLAGRSAEAARQVKQIVNASVERIEGSSAVAENAGERMRDIVAQVQSLRELINAIARASVQQSASVGEVSVVVRELDETTQRNAALAEQTTAAAGSLAIQAQRLAHAVAVFQFGDDDGPVPARAG